MTTMTQTLATRELYEAGQSPWLDFISREILESGRLKSLIEESSLMGVTSNPTIFEKAITDPSGGYDDDVKKMVKRGCKTFDIYDALTISDIKRACDLFLPVYKSTNGEHGFVSLEVSPTLAHETKATIAEGVRLFKAVARPNLMIKVPATSAGILAVRALIGQGINVNITLMFTLKHYQDVANAYLDGVADYKARGGNLSRVHSVASVFVSRIDTLLDKKLEALAVSAPLEKQDAIRSLAGKAAIANSKMIYREFKKIFSSDKFRKLQASGARIQKPLWGSTSTKNPDYSDLIYVENLVGPETVNTMPQNTLDALLDHGIVRHNTLEEGLDECRESIQRLKALGFDLQEVGEGLQREGVKSFIDSFDSLMRTLELKREKFSKGKNPGTGKFSYNLDPEILASVEKELSRLQSGDFLNRFLKGDALLWELDESHKKVIQNRLGWLKSQDWMMGKLHEIEALCETMRREKLKDVVLLGMGGSSLAPEVMSLICSHAKSPRFHILDTTDPASISSVEKIINLKSSLFIVASKSGSTIETRSQYQYFYACVSKLYGRKAADLAGRHFIAITDQGSDLQKLAEEKKFRKTFVNPSDIGGRYSALSFFGLVPAALIGIDIRQILKSARDFFTLTQTERDLKKNPALFLGVLMAVLAAKGQDKLTIQTSKLESFGAWLEQLIAESTGKNGKGIVPVDSEPAGNPESYGSDRFFLGLRLKSEPKGSGMLLKKKQAARISSEWQSPEGIGAEFLRWEIATAVSGVVLGVNPFDEPNVTESKKNTALFLEELKQKGRLPNPPFLLKANEKMDLTPFLSKMKSGSYVSFLAYTERTKSTQQAFGKIRSVLLNGAKVPVLLGFGPRYLHSIGQLYKGGPKTGFFILFLKQEKKDIKIPGAAYTFGQLKMAQALGDIKALEDKGLPVLAIQLGSDAVSGLKSVEETLKSQFKKSK